jgi:hypothetical protein
MLRAFALCLLAALIAPLLLAAEDKRKADGPNNADSERWQAMDKQLKKISDDLAELQSRIGRHEQAGAVEMKELNERLGRLEKTVESLRSATRSSSYFSPSAPGTTGTIRLENRTALPATVVLGNRSHALAPLQSILLQSQPAGNFTYAVAVEGFGEIRAPVTRALAAGETFTIAINP